MRLTRPSDVRARLAEMDFRPRRALGQNFLVDANVLRLMVEAARLDEKDVVLEIGPGLGTLTEELAARAGRVIAVEKDARLCAHLARHFGGGSRVELLHADALEADLPALLARGVTKVISNLPYSVGSRILVRLFEAPQPPRYIQVTVQKEVADRLRAGPGTPDYGLLGVWAQLHYDVTLGRVISPTCFFPVPQVQSAVVEMFRLTEPRLTPEGRARIPRVLKPLFTHRRKQIGPRLAALAGPGADTGALLERVGLSPRARPDAVRVAQWAALLNLFPSAPTQAETH